jgi:type VI secretion system FHA domain protein
MIDYQAGCYYLVDLSRNGVYVNDSNAPVGSGNPQRLFDGDTLRLGEYEIQVAIIEDATESNDDGMSDSIVRAQMVAVDESVEMAMIPADQIQDAVSLDAMLNPGDESGELSALQELPAGGNAMLNAAANHGATEAAEVFLKAAGMDPKDFAGIDPKTLLQNAARLLAEFVDGTHALLESKEAITRRLNINTRSEQEKSNPLRASDGADNALRLLLATKNDIHLSGCEAIDAAFDDLLRHQRAVIAAMRDALADYIGYFQPDALEKLFAQQQIRAGSSKPTFLELYAQAFEGLAKPNARQLPQRFDDEFARAYENETTE